MALIKKYKIKLGTVTQSGEPCNMVDDPKFFSNHPNTVINCYVEDGYLYVQLMEDGNGDFHPIKVEIDCDDCEICPPFIVTIKPCIDDDDCNSDLCEFCDTTLGLCVSRCEADEKCDGEGRCVECLDGETLGDKICINGEWSCPPNAPIEGPNNTCLECVTGQVDDELCRTCIDGKWQVKDCGDWHLDLESCDCVECLNSTHCGPNEKCDDGDCVCEPGYVRDEDGNCVLGKECTVDDDCDGCDVCAEQGVCIEKKCADGYVLDEDCNCVVKGGPDDPDNPDDPWGDCIECDTAKQCPPGYTCDKGCCVPCSYYDCGSGGNCDEKPGCKCSGLQDCVDDPDYERDICTDTFDLSVEECGIKAELNTNETCTCSNITLLNQITQSNNDLTFTFSLRKGTAFNTNDALSLPKLDEKYNNDYDIAFNELPNKGNFEVYLKYKYINPLTNKLTQYKVPGSTQQFYFNEENETAEVEIEYPNLPDIGDSITPPGSTEEFPLYSIAYVVELKTQLEFPNGCNYPTGRLMGNAYYLSDSYPNAGTWPDQSMTAVMSSEDERYPLFIFWRVKSGDAFDKYRRVYIKPDDDGKIITNLYGPEKVNNENIAEQYRIDEINNEDVFDLDSDDYAGGIYPGYWYNVEADCNCIGGDTVRAIMCDTDTFSVSNWEDCNSKVTFEEPDICAINKSMKMWRDTSVHNITSARYRLTFNLVGGSEVVWYVQHKEYIIGGPESGGRMMILNSNSDRDFSSKALADTHLITENGDTANVESIDVELIVMDKPYCRTRITGPTIYDDECEWAASSGAGVNFMVVFEDETVNGQVIDESTLTLESSTKTAPYTFNAPKGQQLLYSAKTVDGCKVTGYVYYTGCDDMAATILDSGSSHECGGDLLLTASISGGDGTYTYKWFNPSGTQIGTASSLSLTGPVTSGNYTLTVTDSLGCEANASYNVSVFESPSIVFSNYNDFCEGDDSTIKVSLGTIVSNGTINYTINGSTYNTALDSNGEKIFGPFSDTTTITINSVSIDECTFTYSTGNTVTVTEVENPTAVLSVDNNAICIGDSATLTITGTKGATVTVSGLSNPVTIPNDGLGGTDDVDVIISPTTNTSYVVTEVSLGSCNGSAGSTVAVTVATGDDITFVSSNCNLAQTEKYFTFDQNVSCAKYEDGTDVPSGQISGTMVTIYIGGPHTSFTAYYDNGSCTTDSGSILIGECDCPDAVLAITRDPNYGTYVEGDEITLDADLMSAEPNTQYKFTWSTGFSEYVTTGDNGDGTGDAQSSITVIATDTNVSYSCTALQETSGCDFTGYSDVNGTAIENQNVCSIDLGDLTDESIPFTASTYTETLPDGLPEGSVLNWRTVFNSTPGRIVITIDGVTIIDSTPMSRYASTCLPALQSGLDSGGTYGMRLADFVVFGDNTVNTGTLDFTSYNNLPATGGVGVGTHGDPGITIGYAVQAVAMIGQCGATGHPEYVNAENVAGGSGNWHTVNGTIEITAALADKEIVVYVEFDPLGTQIPLIYNFGVEVTCTPNT